METTLIKRSAAPVNAKSLLAFTFNYMQKFHDGEVSANDAIAMSKLISQANNTLNYELKRSVVQIRLKEIGENVSPRLREIESKAFDDTLL